MSKKEKKADDKEAEAKDAAPAGEEGAEGEGAPKKGKKKLVIIGGVVALLLIVGVVVMLMGGKKKAPVEGEEAAAHGEEKAGGEAKEEGKGEHGEAKGEHAGAAAVATPVYYELPGFLVNLNSTSSRVSFLKMSVTLELRDAAAVALMDANKPRIQDTFNTYLRELRPSDIQGSAGIYRLRTELISRLNGTIEEGVVKDILFGEIIVQ